jgi:hypothetical protein
MPADLTAGRRDWCFLTATLTVPSRTLLYIRMGSPAALYLLKCMHFPTLSGTRPIVEVGKPSKRFNAKVSCKRELGRLCVSRD